MKIKPLNNIGQHITEYTLLIILVTAGVLVMGPYLKRSWNGQMRSWEVAVKDTTQDPLKEAAPFSNIPCHCEYSAGACTYVVGHERQIQKDLICNPVGCETTLDPVPPTVTYEYAPAGSERCCTQEITPNTCGVLANLPPAGNGHMSGGCVSEHLEIKKTCDDESIASNTTYHCSVNGEPDYVESGISAGTNLCNADGTHGDCLNNCLNSDEDPITDPSDPAYNNARYDGFCTDDIENAPPNTHISYVNNSSGCTAQKCEVKCKAPFVLRDGNCFCPSPWETQYQNGQPIGCQCPDGSDGLRPNMRVPAVPNQRCMYNDKASILADRDISPHLSGGGPHAAPANLVQLRAACESLGSGYTLYQRSLPDGPIPWGGYSPYDALGENRGYCYHNPSGDGGCSMYGSQSGCQNSPNDCVWSYNAQCLCLAGQDMGSGADWWEAEITPTYWLDYALDARDVTGRWYGPNMFTDPSLSPEPRDIHATVSPPVNVINETRGGFREYTLFQRSNFNIWNEPYAEYMCPSSTPPTQSCIPGWMCGYTTSNPDQYTSIAVGAMCPAGYAMKGIRAWNSYVSQTYHDLLAVGLEGASYWYIACSKAANNAYGQSCLDYTWMTGYSVQGPFYTNDSTPAWYGRDCPNDQVMVGVMTQTVPNSTYNTGQKLCHPTDINVNGNFGYDDVGGHNQWWIVCQKVRPGCLAYITGDTWRDNYNQYNSGNNPYFFYPWYVSGWTVPMIQSATAPMCSFMRGLWTHRVDRGKNNWYIKYIR